MRRSVAAAAQRVAASTSTAAAAAASRSSSSLPASLSPRRWTSSSSTASSSASSASLFSGPSASSASAAATFGADPDLLHLYLRRRPTSITIRQLLSFSPPPSQSSPPTLDQLLRSAAFTSTELPIRLSHRVADFRALPFIVASNPYISRIAQLYAKGFAALAAFSDPHTGQSTITTQEDNSRFAVVLEKLIDDAAQNVPTLARGFLECERYMGKADIAAFLDAAIHSRIAIRLIGEQHLALTAAANAAPSAVSSSSSSSSTRGGASPSSSSSSSSSSVGVIDTELNPARIVKMCASYVHDLCEATLGAAPSLVIEGDASSTYVGCGQHLEYIVTELLKNSYRATTERWLRLQQGSGRGRTRARRRDAYSRIANVLDLDDHAGVESLAKLGSTDDDDAPPPVKVTIAKSAHHLSLRIRDRGGGIKPANLPHVFSYAFSTAGQGAEDGEEGEGSSRAEEEEVEMGPYGMQAMGGGEDLALLNGGGSSGLGHGALTSSLGTLSGLGYGLAMARIYSTWAPGGALDLVSLYGHGCDAYVKLPANLVDTL